MAKAKVIAKQQRIAMVASRYVGDLSHRGSKPAVDASKLRFDRPLSDSAQFRFGEAMREWHLIEVELPSMGSVVH